MVFSMIIIPLIIGALAVVITLCYASILDIKDRRVPFITWVPMLHNRVAGCRIQSCSSMKV